MNRHTGTILALMSIVTLLTWAPQASAACPDSGQLMATARQNRFQYLTTRHQADFYRAQNEYEKVLSCDPLRREAYEELIELLLMRPAGLTPNLNHYLSPYDHPPELSSSQTSRRSPRPVRIYRPDGYNFAENPLLPIDRLVERAHAVMRAHPIMYDRKWLAQQYLILVKQLLAHKPNNPSPAMDSAYQLLERAHTLDRSNTEIMNLRSAFRKR